MHTVGFLWGVLFVGALILAFGTGAVVSARTINAKYLKEFGLTRESAALYGRAARILRRLHGVTELDGDLAADLLSTETKKLVDDWLADYRKQLERV